jgi:hypothetical protein
MDKKKQSQWAALILYAAMLVAILAFLFVGLEL